MPKRNKSVAELKEDWRYAGIELDKTCNKHGENSKKCIAAARKYVKARNRYDVAQDERSKNLYGRGWGK